MLISYVRLDHTLYSINYGVSWISVHAGQNPKLHVCISAHGCLLWDTTYRSKINYRRSGFNCEYLLNTNCEFFYVAQLIDSQT